MSKANTWENGLLDLLFLNTDFAGVGDAGGLRGSVVAGSLYVGLHTADPGEGGDQTTSECAYTGYARQAVARSGAGFVRTGNQINPAAPVQFPIGTAGGGVPATHFSIGTALAGAGKLLYSAPITPNIMTGVGVAPLLDAATGVTED